MKKWRILWMQHSLLNSENPRKFLRREGENPSTGMDTSVSFVTSFSRMLHICGSTPSHTQMINLLNVRLVGRDSVVSRMSSSTRCYIRGRSHSLVMSVTRASGALVSSGSTRVCILVSDRSSAKSATHGLCTRQVSSLTWRYTPGIDRSRVTSVVSNWPMLVVSRSTWCVLILGRNHMCARRAGRRLRQRLIYVPTTRFTLGSALIIVNYVINASPSVVSSRPTCVLIQEKSRIFVQSAGRVLRTRALCLYTWGVTPGNVLISVHYVIRAARTAPIWRNTCVCTLETRSPISVQCVARRSLKPAAFTSTWPNSMPPIQTLGMCPSYPSPRPLRKPWHRDIHQLMCQNTCKPQDITPITAQWEIYPCTYLLHTHPYYSMLNTWYRY